MDQLFSPVIRRVVSELEQTDASGDRQASDYYSLRQETARLVDTLIDTMFPRIARNGVPREVRLEQAVGLLEHILSHIPSSPPAKDVIASLLGALPEVRRQL